MDVTGQDAIPEETAAGGLGPRAADRVGRLPAVRRTRLGGDFGVMELVAARDLPGRAPQGAVGPGDLGIAQHLELFEHGRFDGQHAGHR